MHRVIPHIVYFTAFVTSMMFDGLDRMLVWLMFVVALVSIVDKLGKGVALRESIALLYILTCLLMPVLGYDYYNNTFRLARVLGYTMRVPEHVYFDYAIPAVSAFCFALTFPLQMRDVSDELPGIQGIVDRSKKILEANPSLGLVIMAAGVMSFLLNEQLPISLQYISIVLFFSSFTSLLYIFFTPNRSNKTALMLIFTAFNIYFSISFGMFTVVIYMGITISSFLLLGNRMSLFRKVTILLIALFFVMVLQNTKITFRSIVFNVGTENKTELFTEIFINNIRNGTVLFEPNAFWQVYLRANQGLIISSVMTRFPALKEHDHGDVLFTSVLASFIPRFIWPDKPTADGHFNMQYYAGRKLNVTTSMNVGPLGEGYGSFGSRGGIAFMFFLGAFVRWIYGRIFVIARRVPLIIFWIPVLFYQVTYSMETDTMQILNSIIKISFIIWALYFGLPGWFGKTRRRLGTRVSRMAMSAG